MRLRHAIHLALVAAALLALHFATGHASEPYFNNDETRHTMTGVFVRDALADIPDSARAPKQYAENYYLQYPALGLLVWPPFFYGVEGLAMALFGQSFAVGRTVVAAFALLMLMYSYRFARLTEGHIGSLFVAGFTALSPVIFMLSQRVMLEVPTLALGLVSIVHFEKYLRDLRGRDVLLAGLFAAFCALTRFDGVVLLPYFALRILATRNWRLLLARPVIASIAVALILTVPYYTLTIIEYRGGLSAGASDGFAAEPRGPLEWRNWVFYPMTLPELIGWFGTIYAVVGLLIALATKRASGPVLALLVANYLMFSPLAELEARHIVYWIPALALFAWRRIDYAGHRSRGAALALGVILLAGMAYETSSQAFRYVHGYDDAAAYVVRRNTGERPLFVDGELTGSFVYHVRLHDPSRRQTVLRGDKLLYSMLSDPSVNYEQHARTEADAIAVLHDFDPEWIVVEDPPPTFHDVPGSALLRATLAHHSELYRLEASVPIRSNSDRFDGCTLAIYRKLDRNPTPTKPRAIRVLGLGRDVGK